MPYELDCNKDGCLVMNKVTGEAHSKKRMPKSRAMRQMKALYMSESEKAVSAETVTPDWQLEITEKEHTGAMVAFFLPPEAIQKLALFGEGAESPSDLHLTLAYLDTEEGEIDKAAVMTALGSFADYAGPIKGTVNGIGRFLNNEGEGNAFYASFDAPNLPSFRERLLESLTVHGCHPVANHGFIPHITLAYIPEDAETPDPEIEPFRVTFDAITLAWGDERHEFKLSGPDYEMKGRDPESQLMVFKEAGGRYRWIMFSSNAFRDRDGEIVSQKALEADVARADQDGNYGPLRWWHVGNPDPVARIPGPGLDIGDCDFNALHGKVLIESGTFRDDAIGAAVSEKADQLQGSILFFHPKDEPDKDGVFSNIYRAERSLLPRGRASNPLVSLLVSEKESDMQISTEKIKEFVALLKGDKQKVKEAILKAELTEKEAEALGISSKELEDAPVQDPPAVDEPNFIGDLTPEKFTELVTGIVTNAVTPLAQQVQASDAVLKELKTAQTAKDDTLVSVKEAAENLVKQVKEFGDRLAELEGEQPRAVQKGFRASQDKDTVRAKDKPVAGPGPDPDFFNFATGQQK